METITIRVETSRPVKEALPGGGTRWTVETRDFTTEVSVDRFVKWLSDLIKAGKVERYGPSNEWPKPPYGQLIEEVFLELSLPERELEQAWPKLRVLSNDRDWVVIQLQFEEDKPGGTWTARRHCLFFYKGELFLMPEDCSCEHASGEITVRYYDLHPDGESWVAAGEITTDPGSGNEWPNLLLNPKLWVAWQRFSRYVYVTDSDDKDVHPVVGLIRSPNPFRMVGHQIDKELKRLHHAIDVEVRRALGHDLYGF